MDWQEFLKKHKIEEGNLVEVQKAGQLLEGNVIPSKDADVLALKLKTGYNVGVKVSEISAIKKLEEGKKVGKAKAIEIKQNPALPTISILHTGGTIASRVDYRTGAVYTSFETEDLLTMFPELHQIANFSPRHLANMWSENMRFAHYKIIAKAVAEEVKKGVAGIIVPHGTDTMHYTAAALAFMLENCPVPVLLVGAQRSSDRGSSDAAINLVCAAEFITKTDFAGVAICMHDSSADENCAILPATKTRKLHTSRRDAFKPVNDTAIARINYKTRAINFIKKDYERRAEGKKLVVLLGMEEKVALLKCHTNMLPEQFDFYRKQEYKGLVIEGTGLGHAPIGAPNKEAEINLKNFEAIKKLIKDGCIVVMTSQCIYGRVQMHVYNAGIDLTNAGVIPGEDMLPETAFVKLAWLLGNYPQGKVKELIGKNLHGEIKERTEYETFDL